MPKRQADKSKQRTHINDTQATSPKMVKQHGARGAIKSPGSAATGKTTRLRTFGNSLTYKVFKFFSRPVAFAFARANPKFGEKRKVGKYGC